MRTLFAILLLMRVFLAVQIASAQTAASEVAKYPEIEGIYEFQLGQRTIVVQFYFKDGALRHIATGNTETTRWEPVDESGLKYITVNPRQGTFQLEFLSNDQGCCTTFRLVNEEAKMQIIGARKGELDDANADPSSPIDRLGFFERHYRKSEHRVPMRDGVHLCSAIEFECNDVVGNDSNCQLMKGQY